VEVSPEQVEVNLLSCIRNTEDLAIVLRSQITEKHFIVYPNAFSYVVDHVKSFGEVPAQLLLESKDEGLILVENDGGLTSWSEALIDLYLSREVSGSIERNLGNNQLDDNPRVNTRALMMDLNLLLKSRNLNTARVDRDSTIRFDELIERQRLAAEGNLLGMSTGLKCFDDHQEGWSTGECVMIMGPKGIGKSWVMMHFATSAYVHSSKKVLFLSPESSLEECGLRFDVLTSYKMGISFGTHFDLKKGSPDVDLEEYRRFLNLIAEREEFVIIDSDVSGGFNLNGISAMIDEHQPDLVLLDGIHLIREEKGGDHWFQIKNCADGLKALAQLHKIVIIWSGQVEKTAMKDIYEPVESGAYAAYSKASVEAANRVLSLAADRYDKKYKWFRVINSRDGQEWGNKQKIRFDVNIGHIEQEFEDFDGTDVAF